LLQFNQYLMRKLLVIIFLLGSFLESLAQQNAILVFSKTAGYRHASIKEGKEFLATFGKENNIRVDFSEDAADINETNLKKYKAVVFLNTTGDILEPAQQADFERFIQAGGGFAGIHSATDTEYTWPWFNELVGAYFNGHPGGSVSNVQNGKMTTLDQNHISTRHLPKTFERPDEFYDFKALKKDNLNFLISVDEKSYKMGKMGDFHPMSWYREFDGGKSFYTNFGHTPETFSEPLMQKHIAEGIKWCMAGILNYNKAKTQRAPEETRFEKTTLVKNLDEPIELAVMPNGKVIFVERKGAIKLWNPKTNQVKIAGKLNVYTKFEYGLMGVNLDPDFEKNNWVYFYYSPETDLHKDNFLSRFTYDQQKDTILFETEKVILRVPVKRDECCHTGGSIDWDKNGNLFLSTGDDTNPFASDGFAPIDFREGRKGWDALSTSGNTNDLRGKILRITPKTDGTYDIPEGNLFPKGMEKTRPEIYVMGNRNPYRISVDKKTGFLYWGDIGPDSGKTDSTRGPEGIVEFNQAKKAGFYGWPMFTGNNFAYNAFDFNTRKSGEKFDAKHPQNLSPNNTGLINLPPAQKPMIWYGYGPSAKYPLLTSGGANPMGGPVYHSEEYQDKPGKFPSYFDNKFFAYEWMRDWINLVSLDEDGNYAGMERFMPSTKFYHPMDMAFGKDGVLYTLEYGMNWFAQNPEAQLSKIEYNAGNRKPIVVLKADKTEGATPLKVQFSSLGTKDFDDDKIFYNWDFGKGIPDSKLANPAIIFQKPGVYDVKLTVTDIKGNKSVENIKIKAGNALPEIEIKVNTNKNFVVNDEIDYEVVVKDKEDGAINRGILPEDVVVSINYLEGFDKTMIEQGHKSNEAFLAGKRLIELNDCAACHSKDQKSIGPAYKEIAGKYPKTSENITKLAEKIIKGGGGVWGEQAMAAHPALSVSDAKDIADYILSINQKRPDSKPASGKFVAIDHKTKKSGAYVINALYTDKGGKVIGPLTVAKTIAIKSPNFKAVDYFDSKNTEKTNYEPFGAILIANHDSYSAYNELDFTGFNAIKITAMSKKGTTVGGKIELRLGSKNGPLLGETEINVEGITSKEFPILSHFKNFKSLYLVYKNENSEGKPLFGVSELELK